MPNVATGGLLERRPDGRQSHLQNGLTVFKTMVEALRKARKVRKLIVALERKEKRGRGFELRTLGLERRQSQLET